MRYQLFISNMYKISRFEIRYLIDLVIDISVCRPYEYFRTDKWQSNICIMCKPYVTHIIFIFTCIPRTLKLPMLSQFEFISRNYVMFLKTNLINLWNQIQAHVVSFLISNTMA